MIFLLTHFKKCVISASRGDFDLIFGELDKTRPQQSSDKIL